MSLIRTTVFDEKVNWLASEVGRRLVTRTGFKSLGETKDGKTTLKSGTPYPSNDANIEGIVYADVDVTAGDYPCSIMTAGFVYEDRLPVALAAAAKTALIAKGVHFETAPEFESAY